MLFDLDGTLVDSEPYWALAQTRLVTSFGGRWRDDDIRALTGKAPTTITGALQDAGVNLAGQEIVDRLVAHVAQQLEWNFVWMPGADTLLREVRSAGMRTALVTMSPRPIVDVVLRRVPPGFFDFVVCLDDVVITKPHPEAYLRALEGLGLRAEETIALEDSIPGAAAANAAGITTITISSRPHPTEIAATVWPSLADAGLEDLREAHASAGLRAIPQ